MKEVLAVIGKMPLKGFSKTRLSQDVGEDLALKLYEGFIKDFSKNLENLSLRERIFIFGTPNQSGTAEFFRREFSRFKINYFPQNELPFFLRLKEVFLKIREIEGECFIHLTGTDIPDFPFEEIERLTPRPNTIYIGPDTDGGFYYLGGEAKFDEIFNFEIRGSILESITQRAVDLGLKYSHLKTWSDIDDLAGLKVTLERSSPEKISHTKALWPH